MKLDNNQIINVDKLKTIQSEFEKSMKLIEKSVAESIISKHQLDLIKQDLFDANQKFVKAEKHLENLKIKLRNIEA